MDFRIEKKDSFTIMGLSGYDEEGRIDVEIIELVQTLQFDLAVQNNDIAFNARAEDSGFSVSTAGNITLFPDAWRVEADFRNLSLRTPDLDIALHARYVMTENTTPIQFDAAGARHLTDLNILDLFGALSRIEGSPLGGIVGGILP